MKNLTKNILILLLLFMSICPKSFSAETWTNDLKTVFTEKKAIIYEINIRTFNAKDKNKNGIIEEALGEERGNFLNAIEKLDNLVAAGINTVQVMPVTPVGTTKAIGTAGSLYATSSFSEINPQLKALNSKLTLEGEFKKFVEECHKRRLRVIVDLPSCGAYDLYLKRPELFLKDKNEDPIIPADWTDVRLFNAGTDENINQDVYKLYQDFTDMMIANGVDGIRADVANIKPFKFWQNLINETRRRDSEFLFLAETLDFSGKHPLNCTIFTPYDKLLEAGFDGYYGEYSKLSTYKTAHEIFAPIKSDMQISKNHMGAKAVIGNFATHDTISPILINGPAMSKMIIWLNATLPINSYFTDGFASGDTYLYPLMNKKATASLTDDEYYFVHRGQLDIFNFSRAPGGKFPDILGEFTLSNRFKLSMAELIANGEFTILKTTSTSVFAYMRSLKNKYVIVYGNLDYQKEQNIAVNIPRLDEDISLLPLKILTAPELNKNRNKLKVKLTPGETQVIFLTKQESKNSSK